MQKTSDLIWQDTQHQVLFTLIARIKEVPFDPDILTQLKLYAEHHFTLEEAYMVALDYPLKDEHIEVALQVSLSDFLHKWLKLHVLGIDKELEDFVLKSSAK